MHQPCGTLQRRLLQQTTKVSENHHVQLLAVETGVVRTYPQNMIYEIFNKTKKVGITIADSDKKALDQARGAMSRSTASKEREICDYDDLQVKPLALTVEKNLATKVIERIQMRMLQPA
jgi:hypothetical protein